MYTRVKTQAEIEAMKKAGKICARILGLLCKVAKPGMSTQELASLAEAEIKRAGAKPSFLHYNGFPSVICISVNEEIVHGLPSNKKIIQDGDIISFDLGVTWDGMIVDSAKSVVVGKSTSQLKELVETTEKSLMAGIQEVKGGCRVGEIAHAIQVVLDKKNYGIVRDLVGHGVGHAVHEEPNIPNFGARNSGPHLKSGMTIAIEPMATLGSHEVYIDRDGWTVKSRDDSMSAHFEHTVLVTDNGYEILTSL